MNTDKVLEKPQNGDGEVLRDDVARKTSGQESISSGIVPTRSNTSVNSSKISKKTSKRKKNGCYFDKCTSTASKFIGDCNFCKGHFCSKHRLMENHACEGLTSCKEAMHKRNADKLAREQTRVAKIQI
ncbi:hypothetical protein HG537_0G02700 [Torulaspora globosa]|uniref:AN1-type domain-containing protein n=1 Tax=Torulaspora globosa TaxID=48254 RepID=A0A7H9HZL7_9SACH|nr:hypothetical protein HG537_0G02700 [Torulaspora sp. CBS 2947]